MFTRKTDLTLEQKFLRRGFEPTTTFDSVQNFIASSKRIRNMAIGIRYKEICYCCGKPFSFFDRKEELCKKCEKRLYKERKNIQYMQALSSLYESPNALTTRLSLKERLSLSRHSTELKMSKPQGSFFKRKEAEESMSLDSFL